MTLIARLLYSRMVEAKANKGDVLIAMSTSRGDIRVDEKDFGNIEEFSDIYQNALAKEYKYSRPFL